MVLNKNEALKLWAHAFKHLSDSEPEIVEWARGTGDHTFKNMRSKQFLQRYCFVVYASGFKFVTIKSIFADLKIAFHDFDLDRLSRARSIKKALEVFNNERKAQNFLNGAKLIAAEGFASFKKRLKAGGPDVLMELPGIGNITKDHLAKNIGLADVAKADVWLVRAAEKCGTADVSEMIEFLHSEVGESRHVIDVALWTYGRDGLLK